MKHHRTASHVEQLEAERAQILVKLEHLDEILKSEVDANLSEGDPELVEQEKALVVAERLERKLASIEYALRQAQNGAYGICELCGETIDPARLAAVPETTLCLRCKLRSERQVRVRAIPIHV
jgi:RNA polymerase-binding transcription factor DksA